MNPTGPLAFEEWLALPQPNTRWLVKGLIPAEALMMVSGPRKRAYKTFFVMLMSQLALWGIKYSRFPKWEGVEPVPVLFLEMESTQWDNRRRFLNIMQGQGLAGAPPAPFFFWHRPMLKLDDPSEVGSIIKYIQAGKFKIVVLDALTFMHRGDPNSERDMAIVGRALTQMRAETQATIIWVSHTTKEGEGLNRDPDLDVRGSAYLVDIYDAHFAIRRNKKKGRLHVLQRFKEAPEREVECFWNLPPEPPDGSAPVGDAWVGVTPLGQANVALSVVERLVAAGWQPGTVYPASAFREALGVTAGEAAEIRADMLAKGLLKTGPDGKGCALVG